MSHTRFDQLTDEIERLQHERDWAGTDRWDEITRQIIILETERDQLKGDEPPQEKETSR